MNKDAGAWRCSPLQCVDVLYLGQVVSSLPASLSSFPAGGNNAGHPF